MGTTSCSSDVVNTTVSATDRSTTDHVVRSTYHHRPRRALHHNSRRAIHQVTRSHSLRYHDKVDRCYDTFFLFPRDDSNQRTSACARSVRVCPHVCCPVHSAARLHSAKSQSAASSGTPQGPSPGTGPPNHEQPRAPTSRLVSCAALPQYQQ